jgi:centromere/kinetochore protein ZW10
MQSGLIPTLIKSLTTHAALAQQSSNATITNDSLSHLQRCKSEFDSLSSLVQTGRLPEAVEASRGLGALLDEAPIPLNQADIMNDMMVGISAICSSCCAQRLNSEDCVS